MVKISGIVLAAGLSRRMGKNKLLMEIGDKKIIEYVLEAVSSANLQERLLVTNNDTIISIGKRYGFNIVHNENPEVGQSRSVSLGVLNADKSASYMFFVGDQPFITKNLIETLVYTHINSPNRIVIPTHNGVRGNPVIFPNYLRKNLLELEADTGGRKLIENAEQPPYFVEFDDDNLFFDIDNNYDYENVKLRKKYAKKPLTH